MSEPGWPAVSPEEQKKVYVDSIQNLYSILAELRAKDLRVEIESCSGGGSQVDLGVDRLLIQDGFSYAHAPGVMRAWGGIPFPFVDARIDLRGDFQAAAFRLVATQLK